MPYAPKNIPGDIRKTNEKVNASSFGNIAASINGVKATLKKIFNYYNDHGIRALIIKINEKLFPPKYTKMKSKDLYASQYYEMLNAAQNIIDNDYILYSKDYSNLKKADVRLIAFYLPQFHPIPENDEWWGKGFTEWANVSKAVPQFVGHYQPHLPGELGFYDLRVPEVQRRQVELARNYGIFGFCFHYYWFKGKKLLERPLEQFIRDPEIDFPFCICWANENWTRRWDGSENDMLIAQEHTPETDLQFIHDVIPLFKHKNYITINERPLLIIYRVELMPNPQETAKLWKEKCNEAGLKEPYLIAAQTFGFQDPRKADFDAAVEFPPNNNPVVENITNQMTLLNQNYSGCVFRYSGHLSLSESFLAMNRADYKVFKTVSPGWDNEPRKPGKGITFAFSSPENYKIWLQNACNIARRNSNPDERIVFINAWNEWGEGAYLEPDRKFGYAYLQATSDAIKQFTRNCNISSSNWTILFVLHDANIGGAQVLIKDIISWFYEHTSINIKILLLAGGVLLPQYSILGDTLLLDENIQLSNDEFAAKIINLCGGKPDLIYGNTVAVGRVYKLLKMIMVPILTHVHEMEMSIQHYAGEWIGDIIEHSAHFIVGSQAVRDNLINNHGVKQENISLGYASINPTIPSISLEKAEKNALKKKLGLDQNKLLIFGCGLGMPFRKGADLFIELGRILRREGVKNFHMYWVGDFEPSYIDPKYGDWSDYLVRLQKSNLNSYVTFLGLKENPRNYFQAGDIFVLTSREEPFGLVALEAADCSLPTICFENAGAADFVGDDAGFVVPYEDIEAMAFKIIALLENDDLRQVLGTRAKEKLMTSFTVERTTPQILYVCRQVSKQKPGVSVIVPNYNHAQFLPQRLECIFNQNYQDFEVILLDDASSDNSMEVLEKYVGRGDVQILRNEHNTGTPFKQWLKGIDLARSEILWVAESDDLCAPEFLSTLLPAFNDPEIKLAYANSHIIDEKDTVIGDYLNNPYLVSLSPTKWLTSYKVSAEQEINDGLGVKDTILNASAVLFRKFTLDKGFREVFSELHIAGDWYFFVNAIKDGTIQYDARKLNSHRRHSESVIGKILLDKKLERFFQEFCLVQKYIFTNYKLAPEFLEKWEEYLRQQWNDFYPDKTFEELKDYYPFDEMKKMILNVNVNNK